MRELSWLLLAALLILPGTIAFWWYWRAYKQFAHAYEALTGINIIDTRPKGAAFFPDVRLVGRSLRALRTRSRHPEVERLRRSAVFRWQVVWIAGCGPSLAIFVGLFLLVPLIQLLAHKST